MLNADQAAVVAVQDEGRQDYHKYNGWRVYGSPISLSRNTQQEFSASRYVRFPYR
jgi:hypothetical protein